MRTFYCAITLDREDELRANLPVVKEYLKPDAMVVVDGGSRDGSVPFMRGMGVEVIEKPFVNFIEQRDTYCEWLDARADESDLVLISDTDEIFAPETLHIIRDVADLALDQDRNLIRVRCRSEWLNKRGEVVSATLDDFWKPLVCTWEKGGRYRGAGGTPIHEELWPPSGRRFFDLPDEGGRYIYRHAKRVGVVYPRALRNLWFSPFGPDGVRVPYWESFKEMFMRHGMDSWPEIEARFEAGNVPGEIKDWLMEHRNDPYSEVKSAFKALFLWWWPGWLPTELETEHEEEIRRIHG